GAMPMAAYYVGTPASPDTAFKDSTKLLAKGAVGTAGGNADPSVGVDVSIGNVRFSGGNGGGRGLGGTPSSLYGGDPGFFYASGGGGGAGGGGGGAGGPLGIGDDGH